MNHSFYKRFILLQLIATAFFFSLESAEKKNNKDFSKQIERGIEAIIQSADPNVNLGIEVISLKTGKTLFQKNANHLFVPASALKLFTTGAALKILGADYQFETALYTDGQLKEGTIHGNLYLRGSGDPTFSLADLNQMILELCIHQVHQIEGDLIIDHYDFDEFAQGPGWMWDEGADYWNSPMDALTINHSCMDLWVKPSDSLDSPPEVFAFPKTEFVVIENTATTKQKTARFNVERDLLKNYIQIKGELGIESKIKKYEIPLDNPHQYTGHLMQKLLQKNGILLKGTLKENKIPENAKKIIEHRSQSLCQIIHKVLKDSDNLYANCLFKKVGQVRYNQQGSWQLGGKAVREFLEEIVGIHSDELVILDGSGLSRYNLASPHHLVQFLKWAQEEFYLFPELLAAMPVSGVDGSLSKRMLEAKSQVRAKTGSMTGISAISGYITTQDKELLAFAIILNGYTKPGSFYKQNLEDRICNFLSGVSRSKN